jgi:hypothetical protein
MRTNPFHTKIREILWTLEEIDKDVNFARSLAVLMPPGDPALEKIAQRIIKLEAEKNNILHEWWTANKDEV